MGCEKGQALRTKQTLFLTDNKETDGAKSHTWHSGQKIRTFLGCVWVKSTEWYKNADNCIFFLNRVSSIVIGQSQIQVVHGYKGSCPHNQKYNLSQVTFIINTCFQINQAFLFKNK